MSEFYEEVLAWLPPDAPKPPADVVEDYEEFGTTAEEVANQWMEYLTKSPR